MDGVLRSKASQACERCRSLKTRCLPSSQDGICSRCMKSKNSCVFAERQPRQRKLKPRSKARIATLESKVDDLLSLTCRHRLIHEQEPLQHISGPLNNGLCDYNLSSSRGEQDYTPSSCKSSANLAPLESNRPFCEWAGYPKVDGVSCPEILLECGLSINAADGYLKKFRTMTSYFPFVMIPDHTTVLTMCMERPFILLAALAVATSSEKKLQKSLGEKFRICALHIITIENERSIDLLNGLLIYLAWYHFFYIPKREQLNQLLHIAIGMIGDMGLNLTPAEAMSRKRGLRLAHYRKALTPSATHDRFFSREARRAYLGCFYLSSINSWVNMKRSSIQFESYMAECARSLGQEMEYPTDAFILPLIQLQNIAHINHGSLSIADSTISGDMNDQDLEMKVHSFQAEFQCWKDSLILTDEKLDWMNLACDFGVMHVYEMDLVNIFAARTRRETDSSKYPTSPSITPLIRLEVLFLCLQSAGKLAQNFLSVPTSEYGNLSYIQWSGMIYAISIIYRLSVGIPQLCEWDVRVARTAVDFELLLDALCSRLNSVSLPDHLISENGDLFSLMGPIFENIKHTYDRLKHLPQNDSANDARPVHATSLLPTPRHQHACPAFQFWRKDRPI